MTTKEAVKNHIGLSGTQDDSLIEKIISGVSDMVRTMTNREFDYKERIEYLSGESNEFAFLKEYPVEEIVEIKIDDTEVDSDHYKVGKTNGMLYRKNGVWPKGFENIEVKAKSGYKMPADSENRDFPNDLEQAVIKQVAKIFEKRHSEGISSASPGGISVTFKDDMDADVKNTIKLYRNINV